MSMHATLFPHRHEGAIFGYNSQVTYYATGYVS
jgi:hypothetical protein